ncbi:MAG: hypothetical protein ABI600_17635 [Luteolibacter sp.]
MKTCVNVLRITFISGPWMLLTSRLSFKSASMMIMLCAPALLFCGMLTIPAILFPSPQQNAYFYFAEGLNHDPIRWLGLLLGCACSLLALAVPAAADDSGASLRF